MKLPLLLCLLLAGSASAQGFFDDPLDAAALDAELPGMMSHYFKPPDPNVANRQAAPPRPADATPEGKMGTYYGIRSPVMGVQWLNTLGRGGIPAEAAAFGKMIANYRPNEAIGLYWAMGGPPELRRCYLEGFLQGPRANVDPIRERLWLLAESRPAERDGILLPLMRGELRADPIAAWQRLQGLGHGTPQFLFRTLASLDPREPYPAMLLDLIPEESSRRFIAARGIALCKTPENLGPLERWLEQVRPSLDTRQLCYAMARQQARMGRWEKAEHWADHLLHPQTRRALLQEIEEIREQSAGRESPRPAEDPPPAVSGDHPPAPDEPPAPGSWHNGLAIRSEDTELQRLTAAFEAKGHLHPEGDRPCRALANYYASRYPELGIAWLDSAGEDWIHFATRKFVAHLWTLDPGRAFDLYARCTEHLQIPYLDSLARHDTGQKGEFWRIAALPPRVDLKGPFFEVPFINHPAPEEAPEAVPQDGAGDATGIPGKSVPGPLEESKTSVEEFIRLQRIHPHPSRLLDSFQSQHQQLTMALRVLDQVVPKTGPVPDVKKILAPIGEWLEDNPRVPVATPLYDRLAYAYWMMGDSANALRFARDIPIQQVREQAVKRYSQPPPGLKEGK